MSKKKMNKEELILLVELLTNFKDNYFPEHSHLGGAIKDVKIELANLLVKEDHED